MAAPAKDRRIAIADPANTALNGIDYVEIASADQRTLRVHFLSPVPLAGTITAATITGGETVSTVAIEPIDDTRDWEIDADGRPVLRLHARTAGDFSFYTLTLASPRLDRPLARARFSFKAECPSDVDCDVPDAPCPPLSGDRPPIDYLAKDFTSFRQALSDFSAFWYPRWVERSEADVGMVLLEALSAMADDLSYQQDRIAAEATLGTATQRRSIVRHARLVDYEPRPATSARVLLQFNVTRGPMPAGVVVRAVGADGRPVDFETGTGLRDQQTYPVDARWNGRREGATPTTPATPGIEPYWWDDADRCLVAGSTEAWVLGHGHGFYEGQPLLIDTRGATSADPPVREVVHLRSTTAGSADFVIETIDALFLTNGAPTAVTRVRWSIDEALRHDHDLTRTSWAGNLVPATQGRRHVESFAIDQRPRGSAGTATLPLATVRVGPNRHQPGAVPQHLYTLRAGRLAWLLGRPDDRTSTTTTTTTTATVDDHDRPALPELTVVAEPEPPATLTTTWTWRRSLLSGDRFEAAFTVDPAAFHPLPGQTGADGYDHDDGDTIRFGDGVFGASPNPGAVFTVSFRTGQGAAGNVPAGTITTVDRGAPLPGLDVVNPFPALGGADEEPAERVRRLAPHAFRARQYRAVKPADYEQAAATLPWVQRAGTRFRWTGSWLTVFTTPDPKGSETVTLDQHIELIELLNRYRLAGYESYTRRPMYLPLDLEVEVCARADAFRGDVLTEVTAALGHDVLPSGRLAFFHPDRFTFGTPLERSALDAAVQDAHGVNGVLRIRYRRRGVMRGFADLPPTLAVGADQIIQVDNDPSRPGAGSVRVIVEGGK